MAREAAALQESTIQNDIRHTAKQVRILACPNHYLFSFWYLYSWEFQAFSQKHSELKMLKETGKCSNAGEVLSQYGIYTEEKKNVTFDFNNVIVSTDDRTDIT